MMTRNELVDLEPELETLSGAARERAIRRNRALCYITGNGLFVDGTGYDRESPLGDVIATFQNWFHMPDPAMIEAALGTIAAHMMPGPPVWLMLVGQSSSGKTEVIMATSETPFSVVCSSLRESSLLSGTADRDKSKQATGGVLRQFDAHGNGLLLFKDFTSMLQMEREERNKALAALREIYDGEWYRQVGVDGGKLLKYEGKCSALGGCTFKIDDYSPLMVSMGERFLYFRIPLVNVYAQGRSALENATMHSMVQASTKSAVNSLFASITLPKMLESLEIHEINRFNALANLMVTCRTPVERDHKNNNEIIDIGKPEAPARALKEMNQLFHGMLAVGVHRDEAWRVVSKVALDSISANRIMVIQAMCRDSVVNCTDGELADHLKYPPTPVRRALQELEALHVVERARGEGSKGPQRWRVKGSMVAEYTRAFPFRREQH